MAFAAQYPGTCTRCEGPIVPGQSIQSNGRRRGYRHEACQQVSAADIQAMNEEASERAHFGRMDAEVALGMSLAEDVRFARMIGGEAAAIEMERHHDALYGDG